MARLSHSITKTAKLVIKRARRVVRAVLKSLKSLPKLKSSMSADTAASSAPATIKLSSSDGETFEVAREAIKHSITIPTLIKVCSSDPLVLL